MNPGRKDDAYWGFLMLTPALLGLLLLVGLPTLGSLAISFTQWDLLGTPRWVGLANYADLTNDPLFWRVLWQTGVFTLVYVGLDLVLSLSLALALNQQMPGEKLFRTAFFLPVISSMVVGAILWNWIFDARFGAANALLAIFHLPGLNWLQSDWTALPCLILVTVWKNLGYDILLFVAGLQALSVEQLEAAVLDGAGAWQRFWHVIVPGLGPTIILVAMMATIRAIQTFDTVYLMTEGGPHRSTSLIGFWLFQNAFTYLKLGKAAALAYILFAVLLMVSALQWRARHFLTSKEQG